MQTYIAPFCEYVSVDQPAMMNISLKVSQNYNDGDAGGKSLFFYGEEEEDGFGNYYYNVWEDEI